MFSIIPYAISYGQIRENVPSIHLLFSEEIPDSLNTKSYHELETLFYENKLDSIKSKIYARTYLLKGRKINDSLKIADGYYFISKICPNNLLEAYLDSIINTSIKLNHYKYPGVGYLNKGVFYSDKEDYNKALDNYLIAKDYADKNSNTRHQIAIRHNIGALKKKMGSYEDGLKISKENLKFIKTQDTINEYSTSYINTLLTIADTYHRMNMPDSARNYIKRGIYKSLKRKDKFKYDTFLILSGINSYLLQQYDESLDSLNKVIERRKNSSTYFGNDVYSYIHAAKTLQALDKKNKALNYLKKADSIITLENYTDTKRVVLKMLINHYKDNNDKENQLKMITKLLQYDSIFYSNNKNLSEKIIKKYDVAVLIKERDNISRELKESKAQSNRNIVFLLSIISALMAFLINYYRREKRYKERFKDLMNNKESVNDIKQIESIDIEYNTIDVPEEVVSEILNNLEAFEIKKNYLNPNIKMHTVAKDLKTNSSYFSKVINYYKKKNFANYLSDLRIDYCIERLKTDSKFRLYSVEAIGKECGFSSVQSFSRSFLKKTGLTVSYFIKNIEKHNISLNN